MGSGIPRSGASTACAAIAGVLAPIALTLAADQPSQKTVLERGGANVAAMAAALPTIVATETFDQTLRGQGVAESSRRLVAEFAWVRVPGDVEPIAVRDVVEVDGRVVADRARLAALLHGDRRASWADARAILEEGARYNLAHGSRNFNLPTVALFFLHPDRQSRFKWARRSSNEPAVWEFEFRERDRPTVIRLSRGDADDRLDPVYSRGRIRVDPVTGIVQRTVLELTLVRVRYTLTTEFAPVAAVDLVVPVRLTERYETPEEIVTGTATYTNYRRFQTTGRLLP
jgi:hypothetical protein